MLGYGDACIIALSGGADSAALLSSLHELSESRGWRLKAVHVHHGLREEEADRDADFSRDLASEMGIEFVPVYRDVAAFAREEKLSLEEAGRILRYQVLEQEALKMDGEGKKTKIAVAHNKEDNAETILMQLLRGSGLQGLSGIPPKRGRIIRPLLEIGREEIEDYLRKRQIGFIVDSSNMEECFTRNKIRHRLLPFLCSEINPAAVDHINAAGQFIAQANAYILQEAEKICKEFAVEKEFAISMSGEAFEGERSLLRPYLIREMLKKLHSGMKNITAVHIRDIEALLEGETGKRLDLPYGIGAKKDYEALVIYRRGSGEEEEREDEESFFRFRAFPYQKRENPPTGTWCKWFDAEAVGEDYEIRRRKKGDYIELKGVGRKSIRAYMRDVKLPSDQREKILLLAKGSHIIWIPGLRISEAFKIKEHTKKVLEVKYTGKDRRKGQEEERS